jgi:hypothetical protein
MGLAPYRHNYGQIITTDVPDFNVDRGFIANLSWTAAQTVAADAEGIFKDVSAPDGTAEPAEVAITLTPASDEFVSQPPCARNVVVTFAATTQGDIKAAAVVVTGKNLAGQTITESFTPTADTAGAKTGAKAFASITSVLIPAQDGASVVVDVGFGELIGLPYKLAKKRVLLTLNDGVVDTAPTLAINATTLESNTIDFNGSLDGSEMDVSLIV